MDNNQVNNYDDNSGRNGGGPGSGSNGGNGNNNNNGRDPKKQSIIIMITAAVLSLLCISYFTRAVSGATTVEISYNKFIEMVDAGTVESVKIDSSQIEITPVASAQEDQSPNNLLASAVRVTYITGKVEDDETLTQRLLDAGVEVRGTVPDGSGIILSLLYYIVPILLMWGLLSLLFRKMAGGGGAFSMGKSNAKVYVQKETGITFRDVAGEDEAKESLQEVVDFLHNPGRYVKIGAKLPKGALLVGPPGTGKTMLAKAVAGEAKVPFFSLAGSDFIELYVGVGASRVRDLFDEAKKNAPAIIFIDEIDAVGRKRGSGMGGGHDEREQTLNQLLVEMDGFNNDTNLIIIAATNRPDVLDPALLRPGRFDRQVAVEAPDLEGREEILKVHAKGKPFVPDIDLHAIAVRTPGFTGADLANVLNEAALLCARVGAQLIDNRAIDEAIDRVMSGPRRRSKGMALDELRNTAYHEGGHALVAAALNNTDPVTKVTILPRGRALGYTAVMPTEDRYSQSRNELLDQMAYAMGGRTAEEIVFHDPSTGASNDIEKATKIARRMVGEFGFTDQLGAIKWIDSDDEQGLDGLRPREYSDATAQMIDEQVMSFVETAHTEAWQIIMDNREILDELVRQLLVKQTLNEKELKEIFANIKKAPQREVWLSNPNRPDSDKPPVPIPESLKRSAGLPQQ